MPGTSDRRLRAHISRQGTSRRRKHSLQQAIKVSPSSIGAYWRARGSVFRTETPRRSTSAVRGRGRATAGGHGSADHARHHPAAPGETGGGRGAIYERMLQTHPEAAIAANNLAMILVVSGGNLDVALNHAQTAKKALPADRRHHRHARPGLLQEGTRTRSRSLHSRQSTGGRPDNPEFWLHLGQAHAAAGNKVKARAALQQALKLNPKFAGAEEARRALEGLDKRAGSPGGSQPIG